MNVVFQVDVWFDKTDKLKKYSRSWKTELKHTPIKDTHSGWLVDLIVILLEELGVRAKSLILIQYEYDSYDKF